MGEVDIKETICRECLKRLEDGRVLVGTGALRLVEGPCDFWEGGGADG